MGIFEAMEIIDGVQSMFGMGESQRRSRLGVGVAKWDETQSWYYRNPVAGWIEKKGKTIPDKLISDCGDEFGKLSWKDRYLLLRNVKKALAMRTYADLPRYIRRKFDQRRYWNKRNRQAINLLEQLFPSLQFSYSTPLPEAYNRGYVNVVVSGDGNSKKARVAEMSRSHSIWLDPVDAPKELYKYRLRINRVIKWSYSQGYVPIMMTLTTYHRWHHLDELRVLLLEAWKDLISSYAGRKRLDEVDLQGWVRRLEITINDGTNGSKSNDGWNPHFHAIIIVPKDKLKLLSDLEQKWRDAWADYVCKRFEKIFGEKIAPSFVDALRKHGLVFSRYSKGSKKGQLRPVDTGDYLAKIMGYDSPEVYGGDSELTSDTLKDSKIPFDLIRDSSLPAANVDLFVEYALATKGVPAFRFSGGLEDRVNEYFAKHPDQYAEVDETLPTESVVASISNHVHQILYRNNLLDDLKKVATKGYDALCSWLKQIYVDLGVPELNECPFALPRPPS